MQSPMRSSVEWSIRLLESSMRRLRSHRPSDMNAFASRKFGIARSAVYLTATGLAIELVFARGSRRVGGFECPGEVSGSVNREPASSAFHRTCLGINLRPVVREWPTAGHAPASAPRIAVRPGDYRVTRHVDQMEQYHQPRAPIVITTGHNPPPRTNLALCCGNGEVDARDSNPSDGRSVGNRTSECD
jgi:hypothetical protein